VGDDDIRTSLQVSLMDLLAEVWTRKRRRPGREGLGGLPTTTLQLGAVRAVDNARLACFGE